MSFADPTLKDVIPPWKDLADKFTKFFSFTRSRKAVRDGIPIWDLTSEELKKRKLLEPWAFNLYQAVLVAMPSAALLWLLEYVGATSTVIPSFDNRFDEQVFKQYVSNLKYIETLFVPFSLGISCFAASWIITKKRVSPDVPVQRVRRAYLYFDGAYGLWSKVTISVALTIFFIHDFESIFGNLTLPLILAFLVALVWQNTLTTWKLPHALFTRFTSINEYPPNWYWFRGGEVCWAWKQYKLVAISGVSAAIYASLWTASKLAYFFAFGHVHLQSLLKGGL